MREEGGVGGGGGEKKTERRKKEGKKEGESVTRKESKSGDEQERMKMSADSEWVGADGEGKRGFGMWRKERERDNRNTERH